MKTGSALPFSDRYCPIIPMVLVNGCAGIGTGWSTNVPNFDTREIVDNMRRMMRDEEPVKMVGVQADNCRW